jgi:hypothetical protein
MLHGLAEFKLATLVFTVTESILVPTKQVHLSSTYNILVTIHIQN